MNQREQYAIDMLHGELIDVSLPKRTGGSTKLDVLEQRFDHLVDLLAVDQALDQELAIAEEPNIGGPLLNRESGELELSIVMPCLDEADTVGACVMKARAALAKLGVPAEVVVADNGSRDRSVQIAEELGARVVHVEERGYGAALMGGIEAAKGRFIIMGDADDSYDFGQIHRFYERLCEGADLVQGCRLASGGGKVMPGAMPWLHRFGNPALSWLVRKMFNAPVHDVYCGMRGFRRALYFRLDQRCTGMEFATEMIIKSTLFGARISEIPIVLHPDGRRAHRPHLRTFRDGWKTLRFFLLQSPRWLFLAPAMALMFACCLGYFAVFSKLNPFNIAWDAHTLLVATLTGLVAVQVGSCGLLARVFAGFEGLLPLDARIEKLSHTFTLERCLMFSGALMAGGMGVIAWKTQQWLAGGFAALDYSQTMRLMIPAVGAVALGAQLASSSFLLSVLRLRRR